MNEKNEKSAHKAGFVSIVGRPNAGKSTLMNGIVGERLSIVTQKAQTTRHRIMGVMSGEDYQIVYSDTPGIIEEPRYELQQAMMRYVHSALEDADLIVWVIDISAPREQEEAVAVKLDRTGIPLMIVLNKIDLVAQETVLEHMQAWSLRFPEAEIIPVSALENFNVEKIMLVLLDKIPEHPAYFPKDTLTDRSERFFASEIIREKIFLNYQKEIPYSCEVVISDFKEEEDIIRIRAEIMVERDSQKGILIGKAGAALKKTGTQAREEMEKFFMKKIFLEQYVKVDSDWRKNKKKLDRFGYDQ